MGKKSHESKKKGSSSSSSHESKKDEDFDALLARAKSEVEREMQQKDKKGQVGLSEALALS